MIFLKSGDWEADLLPETGGAISALRYRSVDVLRPTPPGASHPLETACFPLVPYCNRIRDGRFAFGTHAVVLPPNNPPERHSLHGLSWQRPWAIESHVETKCVLVDEYAGDGPWPWAYHAHQRIRLGPKGCAITLVLTNRADSPMPAGLGLHPYLRRRRETRVRFAVHHALLTSDDFLPTGMTAPADWQQGSPLPRQTIDNCFAGWAGTAQVSDDLGAIVLEADGAPYLHLYSPENGSALCLEPVTHTPDAPNRAPEEMVVLPPGCSASISLHLSI